ncbi:nucleotidyltransferase family protein [Mariniflexile sp.]|uniref:nucleotidyltransferase family protein n=1 Tax=Mariniflexile sp. TaxID=1979402 RepID=UPI00404778E2
MEEINKHIEQIKKLCEANGVKSLFAFGSVLKNKLLPNSDIDLLVDIDDQDPLTYSDKYFDLKFNLEKIFDRKIDLLELRALKNRFLKKEIDRTKLQIY